MMLDVWILSSRKHRTDPMIGLDRPQSIPYVVAALMGLGVACSDMLTPLA
jgi:hypothetical protein